VKPHEQLVGRAPASEEERDLEEQARPFQALYEHWERHQWSPYALDFTEDAASFAGLDETGKQGMRWIFAHRFHAEFKVATVLAPFIWRAPDHETQLVLSTQIADEYRHLQCVLRVYEDVFGIRGLEAARSSADENHDPIASMLYDALERWVTPLESSDDEDVFLQAVTAYHLIGEGVVARTAQNLAGEQYTRFGSFPGLAQGQRHVVRDESRHIGFGVSYARRRMAQDRERASAAIETLVESFAQLSTDMLETALESDMDVQVLGGYGVTPEEFYGEAMRLWQTRLRSIGFV
jgi:ribonucleotide reductase beta subunit family protein with ferritin-like domain